MTTYTLLVSIRGKRGVALLDNGSTHTFIDLEFAIKTGCKIVSNSLQNVIVAGGGTILAGSHIPLVEYCIKGEIFCNEFKIISLAGYDIILGCD